MRVDRRSMWPAGTRAAPAPPVRSPAHVLARVEVPQGDHCTYRWEPLERALCLEAVVSQPEPLPCELAVLPDTAGEDGRPLPVALLLSVPTLPGCLVPARVVAALQIDGRDGSRYLAVAAAADDPAQAHRTGLADLDEGLRQQLEDLAWRYLGVSRLPELSPPSSPAPSADRSVHSHRWLDADEAWERVRAARRGSRLLQARSRPSPWARSWREQMQGAAPRSQGSEAEALSDAEYRMPTLPIRFQRHVEECLDEGERVLALVERPESGGQFRLFRRAAARRGGLLVVTDRQLLMVEDDSRLDASLVDWGYVATSVTLERVTSAGLRPRGSAEAALEVAVAASGGAETLVLPFPITAREALEPVVGFLLGFCPRGTSRSLRRLRLPSPADDEAGAALAADVAPEPERRALEAVLFRAVPRDAVLAWAVAPSWADPRAGPRLLAATSGALISVRGDEVAQVPLGAISSLTLRHALMGCYLEWHVPSAGTVRAWSVRFESPSIGPFRRVFLALRRGLPVPPIVEVVATCR